MIIGLDFDNTIILYDELAHEVALSLNLIPSSLPRNKLAVRDYIRKTHAGDEGWQRVQGQIYGNKIEGAQMAEGLENFLLSMRQKQHTIFVVSHKTEFGHFDEARTNLREAAVRWMAKKNFFRPIENRGFGFKRSDIFFGSSREEKIAKIKDLRCDVFVDDLPEVFAEKIFPRSTRRILYSPELPATNPDSTIVCRSWDEILKSF